jgi:hypothetical protein
MSPDRQSCWTTWGAASSGFREIEVGWDRLGSVGLLAPFVAPVDQLRQPILQAAWFYIE